MCLWKKFWVMHSLTISKNWMWFACLGMMMSFHFLSLVHSHSNILVWQRIPADIVVLHQHGIFPHWQHWFLLLKSVTLDDGIFSKCPNLNNLTLNQFKTSRSNGLSIVHLRLSNLILKNAFYAVKVVSVAAPQLKNLTIKSCVAEHVNISAPDLVSLIYKCCLPVPLTMEGFRSLEKADICLYMPRYADAHQLVCLLQQLHSVKFLKLNWEIVEVYSYWFSMFIMRSYSDFSV